MFAPLRALYLEKKRMRPSRVDGGGTDVFLPAEIALSVLPQGWSIGPNISMRGLLADDDELWEGNIKSFRNIGSHEWL